MFCILYTEHKSKIKNYNLQYFLTNPQKKITESIFRAFRDFRG